MPTTAKTFKFDVRGAEDIRRKLGFLGNYGIEAVKRALTRHAEKVMTEAKEMTPVDTGTLMSTGRVAPPEMDGNTITVMLGFGGPAGGKDVNYALVVHENMQAHHPRGQAKYLETPMKAHSNEVLPAISAELAKIYPG